MLQRAVEAEAASASRAAEQDPAPSGKSKEDQHVQAGNTQESGGAARQNELPEDKEDVARQNIQGER